MKKNTASGKLRIIGGKWRSRILSVVDLPDLRPTTDRVRETLFNWLQYDIVGASCLDCFAGSGALGFEAASRGAANVVLLELQAKAANILRDNVKALQANNVDVFQQSATLRLSSAANCQFDVVFLDPPFSSDLLAEVCVLLEQNAWLSEQAIIYIEIDSHQNLPDLPSAWKQQKQKKAGQVCYYLFHREQTL